MDRKTVSIVGAIIVVGGLFAFAGDLDPPEGPIGPTMHTLDEIYAAVAEPQCCSPRPEDIRHYFVYCSSCPAPAVPQVIIPAVEGTTGFVITDFVVATSSGTSQRLVRLFENGVEISAVYVIGGQTPSIATNFTSGIPVAVGSTITFDINNSVDTRVTLSGYAY